MKGCNRAMDWIVILLVCFGLAFDVFSISVAQGSVLGKVKARRLILMCLIVCAWQVVAISIGYFIASLADVRYTSTDVQGVWSLVSATIFIATGGIKIFRLQRRKAVPEICSDIDFGKICGIAAYTSIYTLFAAMGCGFLLLNPVRLGIVICILTLGIVVSGVFMGYRNGEINKKVYWAGGVFLIGSGVLVSVEYFTRFISG